MFKQLIKILATKRKQKFFSGFSDNLYSHKIIQQLQTNTSSVTTYRLKRISHSYSSICLILFFTIFIYLFILIEALKLSLNFYLFIRGMTEGITLLILAVQTGLIELQVIHRAFLLSIILFIVVASILQSMLEIADPIVLALGASRDK